MPTRLSLPHEHGASVTAVGAALAAAAIAPSPGPALAVGVAVTAAFFARGQTDRLAARSPLRVWDRPALLVLSACAVAGVVIVAQHAPIWALVTSLVCLGMIGGSAAARRARKQRLALFEALGLVGLGASAGIGLLAAGATLPIATAAALVIAAHAAAAVPLVRTEVRKRERVLGKRGIAVAGAGVLVAGLLVAAIGPVAMTAALAPRALNLLDRALRRPPPAAAAVVGVRETVLLAACVGLLVLTA